MPSHFRHADLKEKITAADVRGGRGRELCKTYFMVCIYLLLGDVSCPGAEGPEEMSDHGNENAAQSGSICCKMTI